MEAKDRRVEQYERWIFEGGGANNAELDRD